MTPSNPRALPLAALAARMGRARLARWLDEQRQGVEDLLRYEPAQTSAYVRIGTCADAPAPCWPARRA